MELDAEEGERRNRGTRLGGGTPPANAGPQAATCAAGACVNRPAGNFRKALPGWDFDRGTGLLALRGRLGIQFGEQLPEVVALPQRGEPGVLKRLALPQ